MTPLEILSAGRPYNLALLMSWPRTFAAVGIGLSVSLYAAASAYIVSVSLTPGSVCPPGDGPPTDLPAEAVSFRSPVDETPLAGWLIPSAGDRAVILIHGIDTDGWAGSQPEVARAYVNAAFDVRGGPRNSDRLLRWDPDQGEGVWHATEETELSC